MVFAEFDGWFDDSAMRDCPRAQLDTEMSTAECRTPWLFF